MKRMASDGSSGSSGSEGANRGRVCVFIGRLFEIDRLVCLVYRSRQRQSKKRSVCYREDKRVSSAAQLRVAKTHVAGKLGRTIPWPCAFSFLE